MNGLTFVFAPSRSELYLSARVELPDDSLFFLYTPKDRYTVEDQLAATGKENDTGLGTYDDSDEEDYAGVPFEQMPEGARAFLPRRLLKEDRWIRKFSYTITIKGCY